MLKAWLSVKICDQSSDLWVQDVLIFFFFYIFWMDLQAGFYLLSWWRKCVMVNVVMFLKEVSCYELLQQGKDLCSLFKYWRFIALINIKFCQHWEGINLIFGKIWTLVANYTEKCPWNISCKKNPKSDLSEELHVIAVLLYDKEPENFLALFYFSL